MLRAQEFMEASAFLSLRTDRFSPVAGFLACRAIELSLKAFVAARGHRLNAKLSLGHDLTRLLIEAYARGIDHFVDLSPVDRKLLVSVSKDYAGHKWAYYDIPWSIGGGIMPDPYALDITARRLVSAMEPICLNLTAGSGDPLRLP